jgi:sialate O-acetylesterase
MALGSAAWSEALRLPAIFAEHGVVQRDVPVPVWGWAEAGAPVSVSMAGQTVEATADADGRWRVDLAPMAAGGPHELTVSSGSEAITLPDQLVGEVWLASGQSNMQWSIKLTENFEEELATCENDAIRFTMLYREHSPLPLDDVRAIEPWFPCTEQAILDCYDGAGYSAVSYYFAKYLQAELGVPVGVINTSWGGTLIEPWTPPAGFEQVSALKDIALQVRRNSPGTSDYRKTVEAHMGRVETWLAEAKSALEVGGYVPVLPAPGSFEPLDTQQEPTTLYNAMVHPLVPYANRGFIWYQGESNRGDGMLYRDKMEALIRGWRTVWGNDELACHFVQLAPFTYGDKPEALPEIWEAQEATLDIPHTGMAVINDIGDIKDIHPVNKNDVGKRLALLALHKTYGREDIACDSPLFDRFEVESGSVRVYFKHAQALQTRDGAAPTWFALSGADGVFHAAEAVIDGATVVLKAAEVAEPTAVRFAWDHTAEPNLMNEAGLPASAFRAPRPSN